MANIKTLSLFGNCGIMEAYLPQEQIEVVIANELIHKRCELYKKLYPNCNMIEGDIRNPEIKQSIIKAYKEQQCDFILASCPCQGFSSQNSRGNKANDKRNWLICDTLDLIKQLQPTYVLMENVTQFFKTNLDINGSIENIKDYIIHTLEQENYYVTTALVNAADYDTPQNRIRAIVCASKLGKWDIPEPHTHKITLQEAIGDLPSLESNEKSNIPYHYARPITERFIEPLKHTPTGHSVFENPDIYKPSTKTTSRWINGRAKRMRWDQPARTILTSNANVNTQNSVHPGRQKEDGTWTDARTFTILELYRICGLPDDFPALEYASDSLVRIALGESASPKMIQAIVHNRPKKQ